MTGLQEPPADPTRTMHVVGVHEADKPVGEEVVDGGLVKVNREEELAVVRLGAEQRHGVSALVVKQEELLAGAEVADALEVADFGLGHVDELVVVPVEELEAGDEPVGVVAVLEREEGIALAVEREVVVVHKVLPDVRRGLVVADGGEAVQGGGDSAEGAEQDG